MATVITTNNDHWSFHREFVAKPAAASVVLRELLSNLERLQWPAKDVYSVHLAVEEALANSIFHGSDNSDSNAIRVEFGLSRTELRIAIEDDGKGFDVAQLADPTSPERAELPSGRGVFLMRTYMDSVEYNQKGNRVTMVKVASACVE